LNRVIANGTRCVVEKVLGVFRAVPICAEPVESREIDVPDGIDFGV
jgi:hypothetical protein